MTSLLGQKVTEVRDCLVDVEGILDWKEEVFAPNFEHHRLSDVTCMEFL
jgi:hypothetical protein